MRWRCREVPYPAFMTETKVEAVAPQGEEKVSRWMAGTAMPRLGGSMGCVHMEDPSQAVGKVTNFASCSMLFWPVYWDLSLDTDLKDHVLFPLRVTVTTVTEYPS